MKGGIAVTVLAVLLCTNIVLARRCPLFCRLVYDPVCGEDSKGNQHTHGSSCSLGVAICINPDIRFAAVSHYVLLKNLVYSVLF
ncbi:hypothetical protein QE152_g31985 [Popillia japonica]|uniref:Kazal-like domain-containing protein n=1 Tax=Popillia japonica TaxID=7064 RepID=A0AAW1J0H1_POPJA